MSASAEGYERTRIVHRSRGASLARIIHHCRGASLCIRHHSTFASFANTGSIHSITKSTVMSNPYAIRSLSGELSRLGVRRHRSFFSLANAGGIRSVTDNAVKTNTVTIHSLGSKPSRLSCGELSFRSRNTIAIEGSAPKKVVFRKPFGLC